MTINALSGVLLGAPHGTPAPVGALLLAGPGGKGANTLTQAQFNNLASWGVRAVVFGTEWPYGFGGAAPFNSGSSNTLQSQLKAAAVLAHGATVGGVGTPIKCYLGIYMQNFAWGTAPYSFPGPCLGGWSPSFSDARGYGWGTYSGGSWTANSWNAMAYNYGAAVAQMGLDGMFWDTEGGGIGTYITTVSCVLNGTTTVTTASGNWPTNMKTATVTGTDIQSGTTVTAWTNPTSPITLSKPATGSTTATLTFTISGSDIMTWQWRNYSNGYGASSNQTTEFTNAQTAGANMMMAINQGYAAAGGSGDCPIYTYQSSIAGLPQFQGGYLDVANTSPYGTTYGVYISGMGTVQETYHTAIGWSTWVSFLTGVASQTTAPVVLGNSSFYGYQIVTSGGPYSGDVDGGWARALAADVAALAALGLPSNVYTTPFIWPYDSTSGNGGGGVWNQTTWNQAVGPIQAASEDNIYMIFQFGNIYSGSTLLTDYTNNPNSSPTGADYVPLNS